MWRTGEVARVWSPVYNQHLTQQNIDSKKSNKLWLNERLNRSKAVSVFSLSTIKPPCPLTEGIQIYLPLIWGEGGTYILFNPCNFTYVRKFLLLAQEPTAYNSERTDFNPRSRCQLHKPQQDAVLAFPGCHFVCSFCLIIPQESWSFNAFVLLYEMFLP